MCTRCTLGGFTLYSSTVLIHCTHAVNVNGCTAIHASAKGGNIAVIEFLVKQGARVEALDDNGRTGEWAPSVASADSVVDPYIASLALTYCDHFVHLDPIHQVDDF